MGRMYGSSNPTRPIASCTVATPYLASSATLPASARSTRLTTIPDCPIMESPFRVNGRWDEYFAAHDEPRRAQQRRLQNFGGGGGVHAQNHAEFAARMFD